MKILKPLGVVLAAGLAAMVVACDPGTGTGAGDTPEGDTVAPTETDPATDPAAPEGTEGGQG